MALVAWWNLWQLHVQNSGILFSHVDINECFQQDLCHIGQSCINSIGSYNCIWKHCRSGFERNDNASCIGKWHVCRIASELINPRHIVVHLHTLSQEDYIMKRLLAGRSTQKNQKNNRSSGLVQDALPLPPRVQKIFPLAPPRCDSALWFTCLNSASVSTLALLLSSSLVLFSYVSVNSTTYSLGLCSEA